MLATIRMVGGVLLCLAAAVAQGEPPTILPPPADASAPADRSPVKGNTQATSKPRAPGATGRPSSEARAALAAGDAKRALELAESDTLRLSPAERFSIAGEAYFLLGDYPEARRKLEAALRQRPNNASDLYWLGRVQAAAGLPALAAARYEEAAWNGLDTADLHYRWALALKAGNELLGKITQYPPEKNAKEAPAPGTFTARGLVVGPVPSRPGWIVVSPPSSAIYQVHRAIELDAGQGDALLLCGEIWAAVNRHEQAAAAFARAAEHVDAKDLAKCRQEWAASLLVLGDLDGYLEQTKLRLSAAGNVDSAELARSYDQAAREAARRGDLQRQIRYLTQAVELDEAGVDRLIGLADALMQVQRVEDAARYLRTALQHSPSRKQRKDIAERLQQATYLTSPR